MQIPQIFYKMPTISLHEIFLKDEYLAIILGGFKINVS
jgi:hypothetical protein